MKDATKCTQAGYRPKNGESRVPPIVQSTTFLYETPEEMADIFDLKTTGYFYTRLGNPTSGALEEKISALDGGVGAVACSSGMGATMMAVLNLCKAGDNFISQKEVYGGTYNLFAHTLRKLGIECRFYTAANTKEEIEDMIDDNTKLIFCETIANPSGIVADFDMLRELGEKYGIVIMCDNTLATPVVCKPFDLGANVIVYSSSKYLDGHAVALGGIIVDGGNFSYKGNKRYADFNNPDVTYHGLVFADVPAAFSTRVRTVCMRDLGAVMAPMNAFLTCLGMDTLHLRMRAHSDNALYVATALREHPMVEWVKYPGLAEDRYNTLVDKYFSDGMASGMIAFGIKGGLEKAIAFQKALRLIGIETHIADARSCVLHPASTTHRQLSDAELLACGISDNFIRLSVGIEDKEDIVQDLYNALDQAK